MDVAEFLDSHDIARVASMVGVPGNNAYVKGVGKLINKEVEKLLSKPVFDEKNMAKDIRHQFGFINGLRAALEFQVACREITNE